MGVDMQAIPLSGGFLYTGKKKFQRIRFKKNREKRLKSSCIHTESNDYELPLPSEKEHEKPLSNNFRHLQVV